MIKAMQVSVQSVVPQQQQPGWYFDPLRGYYYLDVEGQKWYGNPVISQYLVPMAFIPKYTFPATSIGGPIYVVQGNSVEVYWSFTWQGEARVITLRMGGCVYVWPHYDEIGASVVRHDVSVTASTTPKVYTGSTVFPYNYTLTHPKHLFVLAEGREYEVVYTDAFVESAAEFDSLKVTSYSRV